MNTVVHYDDCPVCGSTDIAFFASVTDHSVSGETFEVWQCKKCTLRFTQNVPAETSIGNYYKSENYISHTSAGNSVINKLYLAVRRFTLQQKAKSIKKYTGKRTGNFLDVGAGTGAFLQVMKDQGWAVTGVEPDADARSVAQQNGLHLLSGDALPNLAKNSFDVITLWHVLEHVHQLHAYMDILKSLLNPGGTLFIAVPNYGSKDGDIYQTAWAAYDVPRHLYHFSPEAMKALLTQHNLTLKAQVPLWFDAFYISLLSSKYKNGKTAWLGAAKSGVVSNIAALQSTEKCSSILYVISA